MAKITFPTEQNLFKIELTHEETEIVLRMAEGAKISQLESLEAALKIGLIKFQTDLEQ